MQQHVEKPDGIRIAGIYEVKAQPPRTLICEDIHWSGAGITKITFYEPETNLLNECTGKEVADMINKGTLQIKTVQRGRRV